MTQEGQIRSGKLEDPIDQETNEFQRFILSNNYTADQMREAYYQLMDLSDKSETTPEVGAILNRMREMTERESPLKRFPINRFASLIDSKQFFEKPDPIFNAYVDKLKISNNEKRMLNSIIEKERSGEICCLVNGEIVAAFKIRVKSLGKAIAVALIAQSIEEIIEDIPKGKKYEFTFSEQ